MTAPKAILQIIGFAVMVLGLGCAPVSSPAPDTAVLNAETSTEVAESGDLQDETASQADAGGQGKARILAMGDSMMAWHSVTQKSVPHAIEDSLEEPVASMAVSGARMLYGLPISGAMGLKIASQYRKGDWDWVVLNGGGNDLWFGCGCGDCTRKMDKLISADGTQGVIPTLVQKLRGTGAQVAWVGYLRSPGKWSPIEGCRDNGEALEARIATLAALDEGVHFVSLTDLVPHGDLSFHGADRIHPSVKGSREIGKRVARVIAAHDETR